MKSIITAVAMVLTIGFAKAQTDSIRTKYQYYPEANVYYNDNTQTYWYLDSTSNQWQTNAQLPSSYHITDKTKSNTFYYNGADVWKQNADHVKMYGSKNKTKKPTRQ